jgi:hypothetical protein
VSADVAAVETPPRTDPTQDHARSVLVNLVEALGYEEGEVVAVCHRDAQDGGFTSRLVPATADAVWAEASRWVDSSDLWWSINPLTVPEGYGGRGTAEHVTRLAGLYADLDVKPGGLPSIDAADAVIADVSAILGHDPVAEISSGHGKQPLWSVEDDAADLTDGDNRADARALLRRFGRLVAMVAERHGGHVDTVYDLARVLRVPETVNRKVPDHPVPTGVEFPNGSPLSLAELVDALQACMITERAEDRDEPSTVRSEPADWPWAEQSCGYALKVVTGWAVDKPRANGGGRHPTLVGKATRLAMMHRNGCLTAEDYATAVDTLDRRFGEWCRDGIGGDVRAVAPGEVSDALSWGIARAASMSESAVQRDLGKHPPHPHPRPEARQAAAHDDDEDQEEGDTRTPLERLLGQLRTWVDGDVDQFIVSCAGYVATADTTAGLLPLWALIVGAPSSGKTESNDLGIGLPGVESMDEVTVAGLLTWKRVKGLGHVPAGALTRIGNDPTDAVISIGDMSTLLGNSKRSGSDMELVFAALRRIYDGSFSRDNGTTGETLRWHGEVVVLGAVTHSIDDYASFSDALGARFLYFRVRDVDPADRRSTRTRRRMPVENRRENARKLAHRVIRDGRARVRDVELSDALLDVIDDAAEVARVGRGSVPRESFGQREFRGMPQVEAPYRLRQQLERLARALCALLLDEETVARLVTRVALDSIPRERGIVLRALAAPEASDGVSLLALARTTEIDRKVVRRTAEDLRALKVAACPVLDMYAEKDDPGAEPLRHDWWLSYSDAGRAMRRVLAAQAKREGCSESDF